MDVYQMTTKSEWVLILGKLKWYAILALAPWLAFSGVASTSTVGALAAQSNATSSRTGTTTQQPVAGSGSSTSPNTKR
jgi:hypothetical protein